LESDIVGTINWLTAAETNVENVKVLHPAGSEKQTSPHFVILAANNIKIKFLNKIIIQK